MRSILFGVHSFGKIRKNMEKYGKTIGEIQHGRLRAATGGFGSIPHTIIIL